MTEPRIVKRLDPDEAFSVLSNETRVEILRSLWESGGPASFSEIRDAVGVRDSGQFNYHLDQLVGLFVRKTTDGYELTQAGKQINGAIEAGSYTVEIELEPIELATPCPTCGGTYRLTYEDETVRIKCDSCPVESNFAVPPNVLAGHDREEIPHLASRYLRATFAKLEEGFCSFCDSPVEPSVYPLSSFVDPAEPGVDVGPVDADRLDEVPTVHYDCQQCGATPKANLQISFLDHPTVVSFFEERNVEHGRREIWEFAGVDLSRERITSHDPFRVRVNYRHRGKEISLIVDEDLRVVETEF